MADVKQKVILELEVMLDDATKQFKGFASQAGGELEKVAKKSNVLKGTWTELNSAIQIGEKLARGFGKAFDLAAASAKGQTDSVSKNFLEAHKEMKESLSGLARTLGNELQPALTLLAKAIGGLAKIAGGLASIAFGNPLEQRRIATFGPGGLAAGAFANAAQGAMAQGSANQITAAVSTARGGELVEQANKLAEEYAKKRERAAAAAEREHAFQMRIQGSIERNIKQVERNHAESEAENLRARGFRPAGDAFDTSNAGALRGLGGIQESLGSAADALSKLADEIDRIVAARAQFQTDLVEAFFGPLDKLDAYTSAFGALGGAVSIAAQTSKAGFDVLGNAAGAVMDAWITGQESLGKAIKKSIGEGLRGIAVQMSIEALKESVLSLVSLARYDFPGAAGHATAAVAAGAAAIAAGAAARALGAGQAETPATHQQRPLTGIGAGAGGGSGRNITVVLGSDFADDSPRVRQQRLNRAIRAASGALSERAIEFG